MSSSRSNDIMLVECFMSDNDSGTERVEAEGRVVVQADCELEQEMPQGTMCWLQGASGVIYADRIVSWQNGDLSSYRVSN